MTRPNVLFLVVDSLRYDVVCGESDGSPFDGRPDTPTLDRLADEGVVFDRCFSQGISTAPAMTAMLTGRRPLEYGGHWYLADDQPTFAEEFQRDGYTTGAIHSNPNVSRLRNFHQGFDTFEENVLPLETGGLLEAAPDQLIRYANKFVRLLRRTPYMPAERLNPKLADWIESAPPPWFCWTQYMDVHGPYLPGGDFSYRNKFRAERLWRKAAVNAPEEITDREHRELWRNYRLEVEYFDAQLGQFLDRLDRGGHLEDTIIALVGDHGDEFFEHGEYGHGDLPYDELTHVPLVVRFPDSADIEQPQRIDDLVRCVDILPTALAVAGVDLSPEMRERMAGESLLPVIRGEREPTFDVVVTEKEMRGESHLRFGFRDDCWKFCYDGKTDRYVLYDLESDPEEETDVAAEHPEIVERFQDLLSERLDRIERTGADVDLPDPDDSPGVEERLKALGYHE